LTRQELRNFGTSELRKAAPGIDPPTFRAARNLRADAPPTELWTELRREVAGEKTGIISGLVASQFLRFLAASRSPFCWRRDVSVFGCSSLLQGSLAALNQNASRRSPAQLGGSTPEKNLANLQKQFRLAAQKNPSSAKSESGDPPKIAESHFRGFGPSS